MKNEEIKEKVKQAYSQRAERIGNAKNATSSCCTTSASQCCPSPAQTLERLGYSAEEVRALPETVTKLSAGCGNPTGLSGLKPGESVLDLGSGGGIDAFLAARKVGEEGRVIGVDFSEKSVAIARKNAKKTKTKNVEFRLGDLENLPVDDGTVDVVISNCVINLVPDKEKVFKEAYRVLKSGGRMIVSDIVTDKKLPQSIRDDPVLWSSCVGGALPEQEYLGAISKAGFQNVEIAEKGMPIAGEGQCCEFQGVNAYHAVVKAQKS